MIGGAAADYAYALYALRILVGPGEAVGLELPVFERDVLLGRLAERDRLLADLLHHIVLIAALLGGVEVPVDMRAALVDGRAEFVIEGYALGREHGDLLIAHERHVAGVG